MHLEGIIGGHECLPNGLIGQQFGKLGEQLEVFFGSVFGYQQKNQQPNGLAVGGIKWDRVVRAQNRGGRFAQALDPPMWDGNRVAKARRTQTFAGKQRVEHPTPLKSLMVLKQQRRVFE